MQLTLAGFQYFLDLIKERREAADPGNDFIGSPVSASDNGDSLNDYQIVSIIQAVIVAGSDTATDLHTYAIKGLLSNPQQYALLREKPELMENAIIELLRVRSEEHTSELQSLMRISYAVFCLKKKKLHKN